MYICISKTNIIMRKFSIIYMDGFDEVRDLDTQEVIFSTKLPENLIEELKYFNVDRTTMEPKVIDNLVNIWNKRQSVEANLGSQGAVDGYLLEEGRCSQDEREIIVESLYKYASKIN